MGCHSPLTAYRRVDGGPLTFGKEPKNARELKIACGQCMGCRLEKSRQWAVRMVHEAQLHEENCFLTLTYDDDHLPENGSIEKRALQLFFKKLRKEKGPFRYYACGEYGEETRRAHYHACIFGLDFQDKKILRRSGKHPLYISETLEKIWGMGQCSIGNLTFETAAYTARYVTKKWLSGKTNGLYANLDPETGEILATTQPFALMSLRCRGADGKVGGIGSEWLRKYSNDIYGNMKDAVYINGKRTKPPKYYDSLYDMISTDKMEAIKAQRQKESTTPNDYTLRARAKITRARMTMKTSI